MKRPYIRIGSFGEFVCDRFVNVPDYNEEHTQAQVNELYHVTVQILADNPGLRPVLLKSLPAFDPSRGQSHRHAWEKKMRAWDGKLTKRERKALREDTQICWQSISRGLQDDMKRAAVRMEIRKRNRD